MSDSYSSYMDDLKWDKEEAARKLRAAKANEESAKIGGPILYNENGYAIPIIPIDTVIKGQVDILNDENDFYAFYGEKAVSKTVGVKYDGEKPRMGLVPMKALEEVAKVLTYGAKKYSPDNWRKVEGLKERYYDAAIRHLASFKYEETDEESGLSHLAHAICCCMFILEDKLLN